MTHEDIPMDRIGKIVALAKGGIGGEKDNAIRILKSLCKKHHLDFNEVMEQNDFEKREYTIKYTTEESMSLFSQIITKYAYGGDPDIEFGYNTWRKIIVFTTTQEKYIECLNACTILWRAYLKEKKAVKKAVYYGFLDKHDLYANPSVKKSGGKNKISKEEEKLRSMGSSMAHAMDDVHIRKQLK